MRTICAAVLVLLCGCATVPPPSAPPPFFCERSYTNFAWSYQHRGVYVDGDGGVFAFRHGRGDHGLLEVHADSLTREALLARFAPGRVRVGEVAAEEMAARYAQVLQAREGRLSVRRHRGADMGATVRRCFVPDAGGVYREVFLRETGDWERENTAPAAVGVARWLDSLARGPG